MTRKEVIELAKGQLPAINENSPQRINIKVNDIYRHSIGALVKEVNSVVQVPNTHAVEFSLCAVRSEEIEIGITQPINKIGKIAWIPTEYLNFNETVQGYEIEERRSLLRDYRAEILNTKHSQARS